MKRTIASNLFLALAGLVGSSLAAEQSPAKIAGPLRVHPTNPRYFTDNTGRAIYLTGSHTWNSLVDMECSDPPQPFDFNAYLDFLARHGHNFIRLWTWDSTLWYTQTNAKLGKKCVHHVGPLPWLRSGPGNALDGLPKFDLARFDTAYFDRLHSRVAAAAQRGIYVSVMLFEGWGLMHGNRRKPAPPGWAWRSHPFHAANNINGIDADADHDGITGEVHRLGNRAVNDLQAAYLRKVVDTLNDFDYVLYEVINEGGDRDWDWWVVNTVRDYERTRPKQHPIGITGHGAEKLQSMLASRADWISPGRNDGYGEDPPAWDGRKVSLLDTDHIWGVGGNPGWVWKSFLRGHNTLFMDPYDGLVLGTPNDPRWEPVRRAMGQARRLAERINLAAASPQDRLASTGYCLAHPAKLDAEYLVYAPSGGSVTVDLTATPGKLAVEWFRPAKDASVVAGEVEGGGLRRFEPPFPGDAVLYLKGPTTTPTRSARLQ